MTRKPVDFFGEDSPLFASPVPKKKAAKPVLATVKARTRPKLDLTDLFDADAKPAPKKRGPKSHAQIEEEKIIAENKRIAKKYAARELTSSKKNQKVYPKVKSPADCKNILPAIKKLLNEKWKLLEEGTHAEADTVASWINGVMSVCREKRPKEYDELYVLRIVAKRTYNENNG